MQEHTGAGACARPAATDADVRLLRPSRVCTCKRHSDCVWSRAAAIRREFRKVTGQKKRREGHDWVADTGPVDDLGYPGTRPVLRNKSMAEPMFGVATDANADIDTESDDDNV